MGRSPWILAVVFGMALSGCGEAERKYPNPVGQWTGNVDGNLVSLNVEMGGDFTANLRIFGQKAMNLKGTWTKTQIDSDMEPIPAIELKVETMNDEKVPGDEEGGWMVFPYKAPEGIEIMRMQGNIVIARKGTEEKAMKWWKREVERVREANQTGG